MISLHLRQLTHFVFNRFFFNFLHNLFESTKTMEAGTIASWNFSEGDAFEAGSVLAEIETDKATMGFEAQDPGVIAKILVPSGVEVVDRVARVSSLFTSYIQELKPTFIGFCPSTYLVFLCMLFLLHPWRAHRVFRVTLFRLLCLCLPSLEPTNCFLVAVVRWSTWRLLRQQVKVGTPVVVVVDEAEDPAALVAAFKDFTADAGSSDAAAASGDASSSAAGAAETAAAAPAAADSKPSHGRVPSIQFQGKAGWAARRAGGGSSPAKAAAAAPAAPTAAAAPKAAAPAADSGGAPAGMAPRVEATAASTTNAPGNDVAATTMRKVIAKRLAESKGSVPHFYASVECELDNILAFRKTLAKDYDTKVRV